MIPGPNLVYKCPNCGNLITKGSLMSGNSFGAKIFSDGKRIAPMLPEFPDLTKCKKCSTFLWLSKLKEVGTYEWGDPKNSFWQYADKGEFLTIDDHFNAINSKVAENKDEELFIRQRIWWTYNDRIRNGQNIFNDVNDELRWKKNAEILMDLFDQSDINQKIMVAEINRNLGNFEECILIILSIETADLKWLKDIFISECRKNNKWVVGLN